MRLVLVGVDGTVVVGRATGALTGAKKAVQATGGAALGVESKVPGKAPSEVTDGSSSPWQFQRLEDRATVTGVVAVAANRLIVSTQVGIREVKL